jgi:hypothetical protein
MLNKNLRSKAENGGFMRKNPFADIFQKPDDNSFGALEDRIRFERACDDSGETSPFDYKEANGSEECN